MKIFIGYDPNETVALHVLCHSIWANAKQPVSITPLILRQLPMHRERTPTQSTEFSFSRFLVPYLCNYEGQALFMDCDMLVRCNIWELFDLADKGADVTVVKHNYVPKTERKFLNQAQSTYEKKNWSSLMLFNNDRCRNLTPEYVNDATGLELHQFKWAGAVGEFPAKYNHLVGEYEPNPNAKIVHYTLGTPCFAKYARCEFSGEWHKVAHEMRHHNGWLEYALPERDSE